MTQIVQKSQPQKCFFFRCCQIREGSLISENTLNRTLNQVFVQYIGQNDQNTYIISCIISQILQKEIWVRVVTKCRKSYQMPQKVTKYPVTNSLVTKYRVTEYLSKLPNTSLQSYHLTTSYQIPHPNVTKSRKATCQDAFRLQFNIRTMPLTLTRGKPRVNPG